MKLERNKSPSPIARPFKPFGLLPVAVILNLCHPEHPGKVEGENHVEKILRGILFSWVFLPSLISKKNPFLC